MYRQRMASKQLNKLFRQCTQGYSLWFVKIDPSQNMDHSTSLERSYKELLNELYILGNWTLLTQVIYSQKMASKQLNFASVRKAI